MLTHFQSFLRREDAAISVETMIITPILFLFLMLSFAFFDAFRHYNVSVKAAYTVSDILSRQTRTIGAADFEGLAQLFDRLTRGKGDPRLRFTEVRRGDVGYEVAWSYATGEQTLRNTRTISALLQRLPEMAVGDRVVVLETYQDYEAPLNVRIPSQNFENVIVTRQRFSSFLSVSPAIVDAFNAASNASNTNGQGGTNSGFGNNHNDGATPDLDDTPATDA